MGVIEIGGFVGDTDGSGVREGAAVGVRVGSGVWVTVGIPIGGYVGNGA